MLQARLWAGAWERLEIEAWLEESAAAVLRRETSPYALVDALVEDCFAARRFSGRPARSLEG